MGRLERLDLAKVKADGNRAGAWWSTTLLLIVHGVNLWAAYWGMFAMHH
jgi:hypothetical protein